MIAVMTTRHNDCKIDGRTTHKAATSPTPVDKPGGIIAVLLMLLLLGSMDTVD